MPSSGWPQGHGPQREVRATRTDRATNGRILGFVTPAEMNFGSAKTTDGQDVSPTTEPAHSRETPMTRVLLAATAIAVAFATPALAIIKRAPYPEIKIEMAEAYRPEPAFEGMRKAFMIAVAKKDKAALMNLVGPTFLWTYDDEIADSFDFGRDAAHNFKVAFG